MATPWVILSRYVCAGLDPGDVDVEGQATTLQEHSDIWPYVLAVGPVLLLVHFTSPLFFGAFYTHHLVLVPPPLGPHDVKIVEIWRDCNFF
jgi:hypothetical protein